MKKVKQKDLKLYNFKYFPANQNFGPKRKCKDFRPVILFEMAIGQIRPLQKAALKEALQQEYGMLLPRFGPLRRSGDDVTVTYPEPPENP